jgi:hypothetical protein
MELTFTPLVAVDFDLTEYKDELSPVLPRFFIPRLQEKPQDPIMNALRIARESGPSQPVPPPEPVDVVEVKVQDCSNDSPEEGRTLFWEHVVKREVRIQVS